MKKYLGVLVSILGAVVLMLSYTVESMNNNSSLVTGLALVVLGFFAHILINKMGDTSKK